MCSTSPIRGYICCIPIKYSAQDVKSKVEKMNTFALVQRQEEEGEEKTYADLEHSKRLSFLSLFRSLCESSFLYIFTSTTSSRLSKVLECILSLKFYMFAFSVLHCTNEKCCMTYLMVNFLLIFFISCSFVLSFFFHSFPSHLSGFLRHKRHNRQ